MILLRVLGSRLFWSCSFLGSAWFAEIGFLLMRDTSALIA